MTINEQTQKLLREAVVHCIEIMGLKNPDNLEKISDTAFSHTNARGRKRIFTVYNRRKYFADKSIKHKKLHKVMTFYITEETI